MRAPPLVLALALALSTLPAAAGLGCGGKITPIVDELSFAPQQRSAGYGLVGGMHVALVDPTSDGVLRRMTLQATDLSGDFSVAAGTVTVSLVEQRPDGTSVTYAAVSGTASIEGAPGPKYGEQVTIDLLLSDAREPWREHHVAGTYVASLDYEG